LLRTNRLLKTINTINEAIVRLKNLDELLKIVIREVSQYCSFSWIALFDEGKEKVKIYGVDRFDEKLFECVGIDEALKEKRAVIKLSGEHPEYCVNFLEHKNLNTYAFSFNASQPGSRNSCNVFKFQNF